MSSIGWKRQCEGCQEAKPRALNHPARGDVTFSTDPCGCKRSAMTGWYRRVDLIRTELSRTRGIENHGDVEAVESGCCRGRAGSGGGTWAGGEDVRCG